MENLILEIKTVAKELVNLGWAPENAGNFSILLDNPPLDITTNLSIPLKLEINYPELCGSYILMKISGATMEEISKNPEQYLCVVKIDKENTAMMWHLKLSKFEDFKLTSEYKIHLGILNFSIKKNKPYKAVLHTHPDNIASIIYYLTQQGKEKYFKLLYEQKPEVAKFLAKEIGIIPYAPPGSVKLADQVLKEVKKNHSLVIMKKHGCVATNISLLKALENIKLVFGTSTINISKV